jgi:hypothetical protein
MSKRFCTYTSNSNGVNGVSFIEEGQSLPDDWEEFVWQYAKDGAEAVIQHEEKHDLWAADMDAGQPEKHTY